MSKFVFHAEAERELEDAITWHEEQQRGLGRQFREAVDRAFAAIQQNPKAHTRIAGQYRRFVMRRFPYGIIHWPRKDGIYVLSCFHSHRNPRHWLERL